MPYKPILTIENPKDPYKEIIAFVEQWSRKNFFGDMIVSIYVRNGRYNIDRKTELLMFDGVAYCWDNDWHEGGKVELMGFAPVDNFLLFGVPDMNAEHLIYTNPAEREPANGYGVMAARMLE